MFYFIPLLLISAVLTVLGAAMFNARLTEARSYRNKDGAAPNYKLPIALMLAGAIVLAAGSAAWPRVNVYAQNMLGQAELARAEFNRQVAVAEANAARDAAEALAEAERIRAQGAADANRIIQDGLGGPEGYLRYLSIQAMEKAASQGNKLIYIPTEATIPVTEAGRVTR
jgi:hypothetical protein